MNYNFFGGNRNLNVNHEYFVALFECVCACFPPMLWWNIQVQVVSLFYVVQHHSNCVWWGVEIKCSQTTEQNSSVHSINYSTKFVVVVHALRFFFVIPTLWSINTPPLWLNACNMSVRLFVFAYFEIFSIRVDIFTFTVRCYSTKVD